MRFPNWRRGASKLTIRIIVIAVIFCLVGGRSFPASAQQITDAVKWTDSLRLQQSEGIHTVAPKVRVDPNGGFLLTDKNAPHVRLYTRSGTLRTHFGDNGGQAPGSFKRPNAALRLPSDSILVPDMNGTLSLFDESGTFVERFSRILADPSHQVYPLPENETVLLVGAQKRVREPSSLLHRFSLEQQQVTTSFFPHPIAPGERGGYLFGVGRIATADVRKNRIVAAFSLSPSLYFFGLNGQKQRQVDLPLEHFRTLPSSLDVNSRQEFLNTNTKHSTIHRLFWLRDDVILVQYYDLTEASMEGAVPRWTLVAVSPNGDLLFEIPDVPQLFAVDDETGALFFSHPSHEVENQWMVGRLRDSVLPAAERSRR